MSLYEASMSKVWILLLVSTQVAIGAELTFTVQPMSVVQAEGLEAVFECQHADALNYVWGINGDFLADDNFPSDVVRYLPSGDSPASLTIPAIPKYNNTAIQCEAVLNNEFEQSRNATLQIQGPLDSISNLQLVLELSSDTTIVIAWDAPFTLDITEVHPDIQYCVDVYNVTGGEGEGILIQSECITSLSYSFIPENPTADHLFNFKVTPRSNTAGTLNGTISDPIQGYVFAKPFVIPSDVVSYQTNVILSPISWQFLKNVLGTSPSYMPTNYFVRLWSIDKKEFPSECSCPATREVINDVIKLTLQWCLNCGLQRHRLYNYTITAANNAGSATSDFALLSTHDVQQLQILSNYTSVQVMCLYLSGSMSPGCFVVIFSLSNKSDVHYIVADRNKGPTTVVQGLDSDVLYSMVVYVLGEDYLPGAWPAGSETTTFDQYTTPSEHSTVMTDLQPIATPEIKFLEDGQVCVNCSSTQPSVNACIAIVHMTQNSEWLKQQLDVYTINSSEVFDCFQVDEEEYHIAVFGLLHDGLERVPAVKTFVRKHAEFSTRASNELPTELTTPTLIAICLSVFVFLMLCAIVTIIVAICGSKHFKNRVLRNIKREAKSCEMTFPGIEQPNEAYNIVKTLTPNEAYNVFHTSRVSRNTDIQSSTQVTAPSPVHIYDEPILPPVSADTQPQEIYAEINTS